MAPCAYSGAVYGTTYSGIVWYYSIGDASKQGYVCVVAQLQCSWFNISLHTWLAMLSGT